jgi:hypothetical protein
LLYFLKLTIKIIQSKTIFFRIQKKQEHNFPKSLEKAKFEANYTSSLELISIPGVFGTTTG